jgi:hypothetical protein
MLEARTLLSCARASPSRFSVCCTQTSFSFSSSRRPGFFSRCAFHSVRQWARSECRAHDIARCVARLQQRFEALALLRQLLLEDKGVTLAEGGVVQVAAE